MIRRNFVVLFIGIGLGILFMFSDYLWMIRKLFYRIEGVFKSPENVLPESKRPYFDIPKEWDTVTVETALNSRCTSDDDGNPYLFHWGMFDRTKQLSDEQIKKIVGLAKIPRFTGERIDIQITRNLLTFVVENQIYGTRKDWLMIESGMQQQAICLICASLGVGVVFSNMGKDGTIISDRDHRTIQIGLDPMKPTYTGSFWTSLPPRRIIESSKKGTLPDPSRKGEKPLISTLPHLGIGKQGVQKTRAAQISQLLWAARGRTPHYYKSRAWGMTIPTWGGEQNISSVYLVSNYEIHKYVNWDKNKPTHSLSFFNKGNTKGFDYMKDAYPNHDNFIILAITEDFARALWEVGYQMFNLLLQADALDLSYKASLSGEQERKALEDLGIARAVALLAT